MSKLQRNVDGQTIQFIPLPRIFQSLSSDLPSGAVKLPNGETAYWRLHRNVTELKRKRMNIRDLSLQLAQAFKALTGSDAFRNHYGITTAPTINTEAELANVFRSLLSFNNNRVEYSTISHGNKKPLVETLIVPAGNMVFLNAYRGWQEIPKVAGIKGKLWLTEGADENQFFRFTIVSPVLKLPEFISPERLIQELLGKIKMNLPVMSHKPVIEFDPGQFDGYSANHLQQLAELHPAAANGKQKQKPAKPPAVLTEGVVSVKETEALHKEAFAELPQIEQGEYINKIQKLATANKPESRATLIGFLVSGIMETAWLNYNMNARPHVAHSWFLAQTIGIKEKQFKELLGESEATHLERVKAVAGTDYTVVPGDTLSAISLEAYGIAEYYMDIVSANEVIKDPDLIYPGQVLKIPALSVGLSLMSTDELLEQDSGVEYIEYTVAEGDTLISIADTAYGKTGLEGEVLYANKDVIADANNLVVGTLLKLPVLALDAGNAIENDDTDPTGDDGGVPAGADFSTDVTQEVQAEGEDASTDPYLKSAEGLTLSNFLETHEAHNFSEGTRARLVEDIDGELVPLEMEQNAGNWHRLVESKALNAMVIKEQLNQPTAPVDEDGPAQDPVPVGNGLPLIAGVELQELQPRGVRGEPGVEGSEVKLDQ